MNYTLGLTRCAARVQHEERMFGIQWLGWMIAGHVCHAVMPPDVASRYHVDRLTGSLVHDDLPDRWRIRQCVVGIFLERNNCSATIASIGRDQNLRFGVVDPIAQRLCA